MEKPREEKSRDRTLSDSELLAIWRAAEQMSWPYHWVVKLLITTATRRDEVGAMRWSELDLDRRIWSIPSSRRKAGVPHEVYLNDLAMGVLRELPRFEGSAWVFPARPRAGGQGGGHFSGWSKAKLRLDALSGVKGATLHDIRRSVATSLQRLGVKLEVIERVLGHSSGTRAGIIGVYQRHRFDEEAAAAWTLWSRYLQGLFSPEPSNVVTLAR